MSRAGPRHLVALYAEAPRVPADQRAAISDWARTRLQGSSGLVLSTCHRVEAYLPVSALLASSDTPRGVGVLADRDAARRAISVIVGLESAIVAEDDLLHQARAALTEARRTGGIAPVVDRLIQIALGAGRTGRSWRPGPSVSLVDIALHRLDSAVGGIAGKRLLVVGTGPMGRRAVQAGMGLGATVSVASRRPDNAADVARRYGVPTTDFDLGSGLTADAIVVALRGPWTVGSAAREAFIRSRPAIVDLSAPPAVPAWLPQALRATTWTIDDLVDPGRIDRGYRARLAALVEQSLEEWSAWVEHGSQRDVAAALAAGAEAERRAELERLWARLPGASEQDRAAVEQMSRHLIERILRRPLERVADGGDGRHAQAARELFGL